MPRWWVLLACVALALLACVTAQATDTVALEEDYDVPEAAPSGEFVVPHVPSRLERFRDWFIAHPYEVAGFTTFLAYCLMYWTGKRQNDLIASAWISRYRPLFRDQFESAQQVPPVWDKMTPTLYRLQLSGRQNCIGAIVSLHLRKRQEPLMGAIATLSGAYDRMLVEIFLPDEAMDPAVLCVARKGAERALRNDHKDVKEYTTVVDAPKALRGTHVVLAEHPESVRLWLPDDAAAVLAGAGAAFVSLHFTDRNSVSPHKRVLRFEFRLPQASDAPEPLDRLLRLAFLYADYVSANRLPREAVLRAERNRTRAAVEEQRAAHKERQEQAQQRRLEREAKERAEREAALQRMSPAERARLEEKEGQRRREREMKSKIRTKVVRA